MFGFLKSRITPRPTQKASRTPRDQRFYTLFLAPGATSKIRQVHIPFSVIYTVCSFAVIGVLTTAIGIGWLVQKVMALSEMSFVRTQNRELKHENHELKLRYDDLNQRVTVIQDISKELAAQAKLPQAAEPPIARNAAGGPEIANQIENNAQALERELRQLKDIYNGDALKLANTPNGLPVRGYLTDGFGSRNNPFSGEGSEFHSGQDISVPHGTPVAATANGLVLYAAPRAGYGNVVVIDHGNGVTTRYGHLSAFDVEAGQRIRRGDIIGRAGNTGRSTGTHVHYEVREYDVPADPLRFVPGMVARNR